MFLAGAADGGAADCDCAGTAVVTDANVKTSNTEMTGFMTVTSMLYGCACDRAAHRRGHIPAMHISHNVNNTSGKVRSMIFRLIALHKVYRSSFA